MYFGGAARQESTEALGSIAEAHLSGTEELTVVDLHTGHGWYGTYTLLSPAAFGTAADAVRWEHRVCSIPDEADWEESARRNGALVLDQALRAAFP